MWLNRKMATVMGGLSKQVFGELKGVVKKTAENTAKAGVDIVKGTVENTIGGTVAISGDSVASKQMEQGLSDQSVDPLKVKKQQAAVKKQRGLQRVRQELAKYVNEKKQKDTHEEKVGEREVEIKKEEKQREESEREIQINQARVQGGGTGEMSRKKH